MCRLPFLHKIGCHGNVPWDIGKKRPGWSSARKALSYGVKIAKIGPVNLEIFNEIRRTTTWTRNAISIRMLSAKTTGQIFPIFSPYESALRADDISVPYFPICRGTLPWQPNNIAIMKANRIIHAFLAHLPHGSTVSFCYYLLRYHQRHRQCVWNTGDNVTCNNVLENASEVREIAAVWFLKQLGKCTHFWITKLSTPYPQYTCNYHREDCITYNISKHRQ